MAGHQSAPQQPAQIRLAGRGEPGIRLSIGEITGKVVVAQNITVNRSGVGLSTSRSRGSASKSGRSRSYTGNQLYSYCSDSDSSSDSDVEEFFSRMGVPKPQKNLFRREPQAVTDMTSTTNVEKMVITGGETRAYNRQGNPIQLNQTFTVPRHALVPQSRRLPAEKQVELLLPPAYPCTKYEQQTLKYQEQMKQMPSAIAKPLDEKKILVISSQLGQGWRRVFRHLGVSDAEIDYVHQNSREVKDSVYVLLTDWAKYRLPPYVLIEALVRADFAHVIQYLK